MAVALRSDWYSYPCSYECNVRAKKIAASRSLQHATSVTRHKMSRNATSDQLGLEKQLVDANSLSVGCVHAGLAMKTGTGYVYLYDFRCGWVVISYRQEL
eukprot:scaffold629799_cov22-Prasinocladus_malaysianus.AAC.1